ncbi:MAG: NapC/NirT family cytochrome c [Candidatus Sumerlaeota bacterium]|nr:NapC/NirT family cytochrome c [Candidatus Sumerlaeota bacterium]
MASDAPPPPPAMPPPLTRNTISFLGWIVTVVIGALLAILVGADILFHREDPYNSVITYLVLPVFFAGGVFIILFGGFLEWRRRHRSAPGEYPPLPIVDINRPWERRRVIAGAALLALFFGFSAVGTYRAYQFTDSPAFCGRVCHTVMKPEYTAYQHSPHARVACAECHIGSGAEWYVKMKITGLHQVWAVATHTYHLPIPVPVENLRPARETCEECHWPEKFSDSMEKAIWRFSPDETNTAVRYNLLMRVGGGSPDRGEGRGIHWHIGRNVTVRYWPRDRARSDIPWVEARIGEAPPRVFRSADCPPGDPPAAEIRVMDCIDCHNRPSHIYQSPNQLIDVALANRVLDTSLPFLKRNAMDALAADYPDTPTALASIDRTLSEKYSALTKGPRGEEQVKRNIGALQNLYQQNFFPEQGVSWKIYPNHQGHYEFPGCYRCHDARHASNDGKAISKDCDLCHQMLDQAEGDAAFGPFTYHGGPFQHPRNLGDIWKEGNCTDCHGLGASARLTGGG